MESKAEAAGVTRDNYIYGVVRGTYPPVTSREIDDMNDGPG